MLAFVEGWRNTPSCCWVWKVVSIRKGILQTFQGCSWKGPGQAEDVTTLQGCFYRWILVHKDKDISKLKGRWLCFIILSSNHLFKEDFAQRHINICFYHWDFYLSSLKCASRETGRYAYRGGCLEPFSTDNLSKLSCGGGRMTHFLFSNPCWLLSCATAPWPNLLFYLQILKLVSSL